MDCFFEGASFLVINPDECIDCSMCVPECPVNAIVSEHEIPGDQIHFVKLNKTLSHDAGWKRITKTMSPLPDHEMWTGVKQKVE
jgi:ferredoxin